MVHAINKNEEGKGAREKRVLGTKLMKVSREDLPRKG